MHGENGSRKCGGAAEVLCLYSKDASTSFCVSPYNCQGSLPGTIAYRAATHLKRKPGHKLHPSIVRSVLPLHQRRRTRFCHTIIKDVLHTHGCYLNAIRLWSCLPSTEGAVTLWPLTDNRCHLDPASMSKKMWETVMVQRGSLKYERLWRILLILLEIHCVFLTPGVIIRQVVLMFWLWWLRERFLKHRLIRFLYAV